MTVAELIEELKKQPQHWPVQLSTPSPFENGGGFDMDYHWVDTIGGQSGMTSGMGAVVVIEGRA